MKDSAFRIPHSALSWPGATYRLQFNSGFRFADATRLVPYLRRLGITHCYASPLFEAVPGSTHGYDVCRYDKLNPALGAPEEFEKFVSTLHENGMGLIVDMVPSHMAADTHNPWWRDVLEWGRKSRFASHFDIKWEPPDPELRDKVLLPILEEELSRVLEAGELRLVSGKDGSAIHYHNQEFPVARESRSADIPVGSTSDTPQEKELLLALLNQQHYRLDLWRAAGEKINYRRFFDVTSLAALKMESPEVFADAHSLILRWWGEGKISGLRIDHPDGLRNPKRYFEQLQESCAAVSSASTPPYIVAEKILTDDETLREDWPADGTTGYDFLNCVNGLSIDSRNEERFTAIYHTFIGKERSFTATAHAGKKRMLEKAFGSELDALTHRLRDLAGDKFTVPELRRALIEVTVCFPVYRTYVAEDADICEEDRRCIETAVADARRPRGAGNPLIFDFLRDLLLLQGPKSQRAERMQFIQKFQQLTGPAAAKGIEDTAFYRFNRLISLNEVGGNPARFGVSVQEFHAHNQRQAKRWPHSLLTTSTHDTKRGEDVRATIDVLSEAPDAWEQAVTRWRELNAPKKEMVSGNAAPDPNDEYFFYQTLIGAWPGPDGFAPEFRQRMVAYMHKAINEAKLHTSWIARNAAYENAMRNFIEAVVHPANQPFMDEFSNFQETIAFFGCLNSLSQLLLKICSPGIPDFYQGTELWDFNLVDPDNRRPVEFATRERLLEEILAITDSVYATQDSPSSPPGERVGVRGPFSQEAARFYQITPQLKMLVMSRALQFRQNHRELFDFGEYVPLETTGLKRDHVCAFARVRESSTAIVVVPRLCWSLTNGTRILPVGHEIWDHTCLEIPGNTASSLRNILTGEHISSDPKQALPLSTVLSTFPVALLAQ